MSSAVLACNHDAPGPKRAQNLRPHRAQASAVLVLLRRATKLPSSFWGVTANGISVGRHPACGRRRLADRSLDIRHRAPRLWAHLGPAVLFVTRTAQLGPSHPYSEGKPTCNVDPASRRDFLYFPSNAPSGAPKKLHHCSRGIALKRSPMSGTAFPGTKQPLQAFGLHQDDAGAVASPAEPKSAFRIGSS